MRVGVLGPVGPDQFAENIGDALHRLGHDVQMFGPAYRRIRSKVAGRLLLLARDFSPDLNVRLQSALAAEVLAADCDLVICVDSQLTPEAVSDMRRGGSRIVFWFPDAVSNLQRQYMVTAPYDALFFKEPHLVDRLRATLGLPVHYLPQGANPRWHRPIGPACTERYLVVAGNMYATRVRLLERLSDAGIPLRLYGGPFPRWQGRTTLRALHTGEIITRERKAHVFRSAAGVLNSMHPAEIRGVNSRLFEAAACGGAVISEYRETLPHHFDVDREVLAYESFDELLGHARRLIDDVAFGAQLGDAAAKRALADHTYDKRLLKLMETVF